MKVNKADLSQVLGVSEASLTEWQKEDPPMPMLVVASRRGQANTYETADVIEWMVQRRVRAAQVEDPRARLWRLQADEAELRIEERRRQLVPVKEIEPAMARMVVAFRSRLLQLAHRICSEIAVLQGVVIDQAAIEELVREALTEMSTYDPATGQFDSHGGAASEPAELASACAAEAP